MNAALYSDIQPQVDILRQEIESLRVANQLQERQLLDALSQISEMVEETDRERRRAETDHIRQRQMAELMERIEDQLHDVLVVTDAAGLITRVNRRCREIFAVDDAAVVGNSVDCLFPPSLVEAHLAGRSDELPLNRPALLEAFFRQPDLELEQVLGQAAGRPHIVRGGALFGPGGKEEGWIILASDVSSLKAREEALRRSQVDASESLVRATIDHLGQGIAVFDGRRRLRLWNDAFFRLLGLPAALAVPDADFADINACHVSQFGHDKLAACPCGSPAEWSNFQTAGGRHLHVTCRPMPREGFVITVADMTDFNRQAESLRKLSHAVENAPVEMMITDAGGNIEYVNPQFCATMGYAPAEVIGRNASVVSSGMTPPEQYADMWATIRSGDTWRGEILNRTRDGELIWEFLAISPIRERDGTVTHYLAVKENINSRKLAADRIRRLATHDMLTGLANRVLFREKLDAILQRVDASGQVSAILFIDLDGFKEVNDHHGHDFGDRLLRAIAQRLNRIEGDFACVARFGGDEFALVLNPRASRQSAIDAADAVCETLSQRFNIDDIDLFVTASVGLVFLPEHGVRADDLLISADIAMYAAKNHGGNRVCIFDGALKAAAERRSTLVEGLRRAVRNDGLDVHFQPLLRVEERTLYGFEALARWQHPEWGFISPEEFIPVAEETGIILALGQIILNRVCARIAEWRRAGYAVPPVSVNLSPVELTQHDIVDRIVACVRDSGLEPAAIRLEITETAAFTDPEQSLAALARLRAAGFSIMLDDFGTGYSSLAQMQRLPIDTVKVDRSFVQSIVTDKNARELTRSIIHLGRILEKTVVAEGVETSEGLQLLEEWGCHAVQGYLFARPLPADEAVRWLERS